MVYYNNNMNKAIENRYTYVYKNIDNDVSGRLLRTSRLTNDNFSLLVFPTES